MSWSSGNWSGVGYPGPYGTVASDVKGIGYRISVDAQDGVKRVIPVDNQPHALDKRVTSFSGSDQRLPTGTGPDGRPRRVACRRPEGNQRIRQRHLNLWAVDGLKGEASIGSVLAVPADNYPPGFAESPIR